MHSEKHNKDIYICAPHRLMQSQSRILHLKKFQNDVHLVDDSPFGSSF